MLPFVSKGLVKYVSIAESQFIAESQMEHFVKLVLYLLNHEIILVLLYTWTLGAWTPDTWTLDAWTLVELTLDDWALDASTLNSEETAI